MKQQYLTPSQVEELRGLGVEFDTTDIETYIVKRTDIENALSLELGWREVMRMERDNISFDCFSPIRLQEVLEKLPKILKSTIADLDMPLAISYCEVTKRWYAGYEYTGIDHGLVSAGDTPLEAVFNLAKEVATHHPESLTEID